MTLLPVTHADADIAIVGSGFAGALTALCLRKRGRRVVMVERGRHPRFAIGESSTPLANLLIEELADRYDLPRIRSFSKWGTWQRAHPDVACGLKRGFTFFFHRPREVFPADDDGDRARQLMVAASPHDEIADTHWYRPDFDHALVREAEAEGAIYLDETQLTAFREDGSRVVLEGTRNGQSVRITAGFVIDASGPRGFLHRLLGLEEAPLRWLPPTQAVFTHFEGVERWDDRAAAAAATAAAAVDRRREPPHPDPLPASGARASMIAAMRVGTSLDAAGRLPIEIGRPRQLRIATSAPSGGAAGGFEPPPYPADDAALHHVFPGGWIWMLRFNNGITSAGAALTEPVAARLRASEGAAAWDRLLDELPSVREQFREARAVLPFVYAPRVAFRCRQVCGERWALLPSAAGVIDPLLSTGFPLTLLGIGRLLDLLEGTSPGPDRDTALRAYAQITQDELDVTEQLVGALYRNLDDPPLFKRLGLLYFAAASYSEAARRLKRPALAPGFLLHAHPRFGPELRACAALAASPEGIDREALFARIDRAIEPFDTAGLLDRTRRDWYPVLADDLIAGASKLDATMEEIERLLERCGFASRSAASRP